MNRISQEAPATKPSSADLDASLVRGVAWVGAARWSTQALTWVATLVIARILSPSDYGIFSMATLYLGLLALVTEFGLGSAIIAIRDLHNRQIAELNAVSVLLGAFGLLLTWAAAIPLGRFFHSPELPAVLMVLSFGFLITSFQSVPTALLQRDLRFKLVSIIEFIKTTTTIVIMLALAFMHAGYWTLVAGSLIGSLVSTILTLIWKRHGFALPNRQDLSHAMRYSWQVLVARVGWYSYSNSDFLIAGRVLGPVVLGYYTLAWNLANMPIDKITTMVGSVTPGIYSAAQQDLGALRRYLLKPMEVLALLLFPLMAGLALVSKPAVLLLLGSKWEDAILSLQLLSLYACIRSIMPLFGQVLLVTGDPGFVMWVNIVSAIVFPLAFLFGAQWGAAGIAATWVVVYPINAIPLYLRVKKRILLKDTEFFGALWPGIHGTLLMSGGVFAVGYLLAGRPLLLLLVVQITTGVLLYSATLLIFHRTRIGIFTRVLALLRFGISQSSK